MHVDTYHVVGDITCHAQNTYTVRYHTAELMYFGPRGRLMPVGYMEVIPIRGLEGAARTIEEALGRVAFHYDESKDNLIASEAA
jgi:hypothetical protein